MKRIKTLTFAFALLIGTCAISFAQGPPEAFEETFTIDDICNFPVLVQLRGKEGVIALPNGTLMVTAPGEYTVLTNLDDPNKSTKVSITGVIRFSLHDNGDVLLLATGRNLLIGDPSAPFVIAVGSFNFTVDAVGNLVEPLSGNGQLIDVCRLLS